ncbi:MAG: DUF3048 domain-containing protein [Chloroflexi bacterium]|nr:DUF3048 domain-containing protein [Chloroflexota bacterium]
MRTVQATSGLFMLLLILSGCGASPATSSPIMPSPPVTATAQPPALATATSSPTATALPTPTDVPTATPAPYIGPEAYDDAINPLTGLPFVDADAASRRPLIIKISNAPPVVRPQSGLSYADMIYEHYAEGGWTRFTAIFYGQGFDHIGSVRSVRLIDLELTAAYDGLLIFSGGSLGVIDTLEETPLYPRDVISPQFGYGEPWFVRFPREGLPFEHTLFTDSAQLWGLASDRGDNRPARLSSPGMAFWQGIPDGGQPARSADLTYARTQVRWQYDPVSGSYQRWTDGIPHSDATTAEQIAFENVIVLSTYHEEIELFPEKYFGEEKSMFINLIGSGPISLLRDGQVYDGLWQRQQPDDMITFLDQNGEPLSLKPGQTFVQVIRLGFERLTIQP